MVDLSKEFETFYNNHVVLSRKDQNELRKKKNTNIKRLKSGLIEYNKENYTSYSVADTLVQGSMAMYTVVQNDNKDYDIDVAIIFDKDNLGNDIGAIKAKNIVCEALKKKCTQLKNDPEVKKNCVTVSYTDGYHIDFAVYRRYKKYSWDEEYTYEHAGPQQWEERNPKAINEWFSDEIDNKGIVLRKVIRLSKMFCKSRDSWGEMPGGLIQTVLCDEKIATLYERLDEIFYYTMKAVNNRLQWKVEVYNPTDTTKSLNTVQSHYDKMDRWKNHLSAELSKLDEVILDKDSKEDDVKEAWYKFFNHEYWNEEKAISESRDFLKSLYSYTDTEQFIEDLVDDCTEQYFVDVTCKVKANCTHDWLYKDEFLDKFPVFKKVIPRGLSIELEMRKTNVPEPYSVWWKVRNVGEEAYKRNCIRGQIEKNKGKKKIEHSDFKGSHYVDCYIVKDNKCVARECVDVTIGNDSL